MGLGAQTVTNLSQTRDIMIRRVRGDEKRTAHFNYGYYADVSPVNSRIVLYVL